MALEKGIIKASTAGISTFDYKAREITRNVSPMARSFVDQDAGRSPDFKISQLVAEQTGINQLENEAQQDRINAQVLARLAEIQEKAYKEGFELGQIEGAEKAFQENKIVLMEKLKQMEAQLKRMEELKQHLLVENEAQLIKLVFLTAKKIAMRDLEEHREAVWEVLKNTANELQQDEHVIVKLASEDVLFLESLQDKSGERIESLKRVKFVADDNIKPGGCMIETEYGSVNATVEERVERTWATLQSRIPHKPRES